MKTPTLQAAALGTAAALALALLPGLPAAWFAMRDASLAGRVLAAETSVGLLSPAGQTVEVACQLWLARDDLSNGYNPRTATAAELDEFAAAFDTFCQAGVLPDAFAAPLRQAVTAALPEDLEISPRDRGLVTWTLHIPDSDAFVQMEWVGDTAVSLAGQYNAGATLDTAAAADALCALLGLDTLADWQTLAATPAHGTLHTRYSADGQLYLHATFQEGYFSVGVSSVPEDDLAGLA